MDASIRGTVLFAAILILASLSVSADPLLFDDGGDHVIDYAVENDSIVIRNATRVTVTAGGFTPAIELQGGQLVLDGGSIARLTQGSLAGGPDNAFQMLSGEIRGDVDKWEGTTEILGGRIAGNVRVSFGGIRIAGDPEIGGVSGAGTACCGAGLVRIEGGRIGTVVFSRDSFAQVQFLGGTIESLRISADDGGTLEMRGGTICCGLTWIPSGQIFAGSIGTLIDAQWLTVFDGELTGGISGGRFFGIANLTLLGGRITGPDFALRGLEMTTINLYGGLFDGPFLGYDDTVFNVYGRELMFDGSMLSGFLADGNRIDVPVQLFSDRATVRLFAVPEPAGTALLLLGLAGLALTARRAVNRTTASRATCERTPAAAACVHPM